QHGHDHGHGHAHDNHSHGHDAHGHGHEHAHNVKPFDSKTEDFTPHAPGWAMNAAIGIVALLSIVSAALYFVPAGGEGGHGEHGGWVPGMIAQSSAAFPAPHYEKGHSGSFLGMDPHEVMYYASAVVGLVGILIAAFLHGARGPAGLFLGN